MRKVVSVFLAALIAVSVSQSAFADPIRDRQYWLSDYGFTSAWELTSGEGVKVAIIDTGIDASHPSLQGAVVGGTDVSGLGSQDGLTPVGQNSYHGTMVASLLAGRGNPEDSSAGVLGTAPKAQLLSISMAFGVDGLDTDSQIAEGIIWAVDNGASVINLSLTRNSVSWPTGWDEAFLYAFENDVVIVAAVGNRLDGTEQVSAPATIPGVIAVAGVDKDAHASELSSTSGFTIGVTAPSEELVAAYPGGEYRIWSGTSGAAPIVSGMVALIRSLHPELDAANVVNRVVQSARKVGFENYSSSYGYGLIDAEAALGAKIPLVTENPLGSLAEWIELYRSESTADIAPGEILTPIDSTLVEIEQPVDLQPSLWLPVAGYAGLGLLATFLYFAFRPKAKGSNSDKRK
ncbi:MAG: S8 family serine peptidase [Actinobacteria bacterium]|nr:S8 family serine peptidase [Actinomycetota bacterium]